MLADKTMRCRLVAATVASLLAGPATAAVSLGTDWGNGDFDDVQYGDTGLAYVTSFLYVGDLSSTESPTDITSTTSGLDYDYAVNGLGSGMMEVTYRFTNEDVLPWSDMRFMVNVQADGSVTFNDSATVQWGAKGDSGDPDHYQVEEWGMGPLGASTLQSAIVSNNGLADTNTCGTPCDVDMALEWDLASLEPGQIWTITVGLADDGSRLSERFLAATSVDTANTELTFSGNATVVPAPGALLLMASALAGIATAGRRVTPARRPASTPVRG